MRESFDSFVFMGVPKAVQSFRFTKKGRRYQPSEVVEWKNYIRLLAMTQIAEKDNFQMFCGPVEIEVEFIFPPIQSWNKATKEAFESGGKIYKTTKPDLTDNLMKGLIDALSGIIWERDQLICKESSEKFYGKKPQIILRVKEIN